MTTRTVVAALAAVLALATGAAAQDGGVAERGNRSIALSVLGGPGIGIWTRMGDRADLGIEFAASVSSDENEDAGTERNDWSLRVGPALKLYSARTGPFAPYTYGTVFVGYGRAEISPGAGADIELTNLDVGAALGLGLDWFPARQVSVGGHVGVDGAWSQSDFESGTTSGSTDGFRFSTFTSGIRIHLFF